MKYSASLMASSRRRRAVVGHDELEVRSGTMLAAPSMMSLGRIFGEKTICGGHGALLSRLRGPRFGARIM